MTIHLDFHRVPILEGTLRYVSLGMVSGGAYRNEKFYGARLSYDPRLTADQRMVLNDPQTSGGLLIAIAKDRGKDLVRDLIVKGVKTAAIIG